ncbi:hypothetical protein SSS_04611 [Sarcoptes scabiei]|nr:hypothetical protein SSS_04611 [Sarcoptes scabiei]
MYYEPNWNEFSSAETVGKWIRSCYQLNLSVSKVIELPFYRFWSTVIFNNDLHQAIESYLIYSSRPYRLHPDVKLNNEQTDMVNELRDTIAKYFLRILIHSENPKIFFTKSHHCDLLIQRNLVTMPTIMDLIQIYGGFDDKKTMRIYRLLIHSLSSFIGERYDQFESSYLILLQEYQNFFENYENFHNQNTDVLFSVIENITDVLVSLCRLMKIETRISAIILNIGLIESMLDFYQKYIPFITKKLQSKNESLGVNRISQEFNNFLLKQLSLQKTATFLFFNRWKAIVFNINRVVEGGDDDENDERKSKFLKSINRQKLFYQDYSKHFDFDKELGFLLPKDSNAVELNPDEISQSSIRLTNYSDYNHPSSAVQDDRSSDLAIPPLNDDIRGKISMIKDLFQDLGDGFILKCLQYFDLNAERVIDAILENNLPEELVSLNRQLKLLDLQKFNNKHLNLKNTIENDPIVIEAIDRIDEDLSNLSEIHIGKKNKFRQMKKGREEIRNKTIALASKMIEKDEMMRENIQMLLEKGKLSRNDLKTNEDFLGYDILYADEFDDTYEQENVFDLDVFDEEQNNNEDDDKDVCDEIRRDHEDENIENNLSTLASDPDSIVSNETKSSKATARPINRVSDQKYQNCSRYFRKQLYHQRDRYHHQNQQQQQQQSKSNAKEIHSNSKQSTSNRSKQHYHSNRKASTNEDHYYQRRFPRK